MQAAPVLAEAPAPEIIAPVQQVERLAALDSLRGFALLGILLMNIVGFGLHIGSYDDLLVAGGSTNYNQWIWAVMHVLAEGKMRCLFSLVFGASVILFTSKLEARGKNSADLYYRRTLWLILFGILHAYFLWLGDILYAYGMCALVLYPFRVMKAKSLLIIGGVLVVLTAASYIGMGYSTSQTVSAGREAIAAEKSGKKLTEKQQDAKKEYEDYLKESRPSPEALQKDAEAWRGNFASVMAVRAKIVMHWHNLAYYLPVNWDIWSMMFIGMGLMKLGILGAERSYKMYWLMVLIGYGIGIPLNAYTAWLIITTNFDPALHQFANSTYDIGRLSIALGHLGAIMLLCKSGWLKGLMSSLGAVGQMAFSNYIMQSVICAFIFTGYGFKLYGRLERYQLYYVVAGIWIFQMIVSPLWLRYYRFGPLEWCWRSLTYWKRQPMRVASYKLIPKGEAA